MHFLIIHTYTFQEQKNLSDTGYTCDGLAAHIKFKEFFTHAHSHDKLLTINLPRFHSSLVIYDNMLT